MENPYNILEIESNASREEIKKAYRRLVFINHPDKGGDAEKFKKIQGAYEILSDPQKRQNLDQFGNAEGAPQGFPPGFDIFSQMFGGGFGFPGHGAPTKRPNREHTLNISLEDAYRGLTKHLKITLSKACFACRKKCSHCHGKGSVHIQMGPMVMQQPCQHCGGSGGSSNGCEGCNFKSKKNEQLNLELKIPQGVEDGAIMTAHGLGEQPQKPEEEPGDLLFHIKIGDHPEFLRQGLDIVWTTTISFENSVNGKVLQIPHFDGPIKIDTADWGVLDPREDYIVPFKGFKNGDKVGRLRIQFNIIYPNSKTKFTLTREP